MANGRLMKNVSGKVENFDKAETCNLEGLRLLFAFGVPFGRSKIQRAIGRFLDGRANALDGAPNIKAQIEEAILSLQKGPQRDLPRNVYRS